MNNKCLKTTISLIKYHFEKDEIMFKKACNELVKNLFKNGKNDLAEYIEAQMYQEHVWTTQEVKTNE